ncbi:MAG TPA: response regulator [Desulfuromonadales bacterium]|nr:response regulator [Desulfuromonadales bacterium]
MLPGMPDTVCKGAATEGKLTMESQEKTTTILIVDDIAANVMLLKGLLKKEYAISTASSGKEALEIARTTLPDLILLDIMMPEMDGYEVCQALKADAATEKIPVLFVTALLEPGDETKGFEVGAVDFITKPIVGDVVRARVRAHLALKAAQDELAEWNNSLKTRLLQSIKTIRVKTDELMSAEEKASDLRGYSMTLDLLSGVFELMEDRFGIRARAISELAGDAARQMKLSGLEVAKIRLAGLLHDVGTLGKVKDLIREDKNESEMTANEVEAYHAHPLRGEDLFTSIEDLQDVGLMVRGHHELYGGGGFPDGLQGEAIPLGARLIAVADVIERAANSVSDNCSEFAMMKARLYAPIVLDPTLIRHFNLISRTLYFDPKKTLTNKEVEVPPNELVSGMRLSRDVNNEARMLLLQKGEKLDVSGISLIRSNCRMKQIIGGVWVYVYNED